MPTPTKGARLGGSPAHQKAILSNLATSLFEHGSITTTEAKARRLRPFAEKLISKAKRGDLHNRRQVMSVVRDKGVVHTLFTEIGPRYADRPGGYTRITKIGPRKGDNAPMAVIALVEEELASQTRTPRPADRPARRTPPTAAPVEEPSIHGEAADEDQPPTGATAVDEALGAEEEPTGTADVLEAEPVAPAESIDESAAVAEETPVEPDDGTDAAGKPTIEEADGNA